MRSILSLLAVAFSLVAFSSAQAATVWDESINGDFSNDSANAQQMTLTLGSNLILGTTGTSITLDSNGAPVSVIDRDYFTVTVAKGQQLDAIRLFSLEHTNVIQGDRSFLGFEAGDHVTTPFNTQSPASLLGYVLYGLSDRGSDLLSSMKNAPGAIHFSTPLGAGTYAFWNQDFNTGTIAYGFDFQVSAAPVPLPGALLLMSGGLGMLGTMRRSRRS